jgi:predicted nuclease of restriction endonuclease-like (RecB) superfamily
MMSGRKKNEPEGDPMVRYDGILADVTALVEEARRTAARSVNAVMTATYWAIGRLIVEHQQEGRDRAGYGEQLLKRLSRDLGERFGRGFSLTNLKQFRNFYLHWRVPEKGQTPSDQMAIGKGQTPSDQSREVVIASATGDTGLPLFPLSWSHYVRLMTVENADARRFYEDEALRGGWTVRQLHRQVSSQFYERTALSRDKASMLRKGEDSIESDSVSAEEAVKDPYLLEFLDLRDEYSESDLEVALVRRLEEFLLELGAEFTFVGRQRRLRIGDAWYRVDLVFYHRRLRCIVIVDLKLGELSHADAGQMNLYCNYAREHWTLEGENPPVGLILCAQKDASVAHYALEGLASKVLAAEYRTVLPDEKTLVAEIERARKLLVRRGSSGNKSETIDVPGSGDKETRGSPA